MKPKFKTLRAWEQAQVLMQPAFIRIIDNIRKELDDTSWQGTYQEIQSPYPGYKLHLTQQNQSVIIDIWELCYQVCFLNYDCTTSQPVHRKAMPAADSNATSQEDAENPEISQEVEIDTTLLDETGEVDWQSLETKAQRVVKVVFANLPLPPLP